MKKLLAFVVTLVAFVIFADIASAQMWGRGRVNDWAGRQDNWLCSRDPGCNGQDGTPPKYLPNGGYYHGGDYGQGYGGYRPMNYRPPQIRQESPFVMRWRQAFAACDGTLRPPSKTIAPLPINGQMVVLGGGGRSTSGRACFWINTQYTTGMVPSQQLGNFATIVAVNEQAFVQIWADLFSQNDVRVYRALEGIRKIAVRQGILPESALAFPLRPALQEVVRSEQSQTPALDSECGEDRPCRLR